MAVFTPGKTIITKRPYITVSKGLKPGKYYFQLVVVDEHGNRSKRDQVLVTIVKSRIGVFTPIRR